MSRPRRHITASGKIECYLCKELRHISEYYTAPVYDDSPLEAIWYEEDGKLYGKPGGYDRKCQSAMSSKKPGKREARLQEVAAERAKALELTPEEAEALRFSLAMGTVELSRNE